MGKNKKNILEGTACEGPHRPHWEAPYIFPHVHLAPSSSSQFKKNVSPSQSHIGHPPLKGSKKKTTHYNHPWNGVNARNVRNTHELQEHYIQTNNKKKS
jgi:hypothetical protein